MAQVPMLYECGRLSQSAYLLLGSLMCRTVCVSSDFLFSLDIVDLWHLWVAHVHGLKILTCLVVKLCNHRQLHPIRRC